MRLVVAIVLVVVGLAGIVAAPAVARWWIVHTVRRTCDGCTFRLDHLAIGFHGLSATGIRYASAADDSVRVSFSIARMVGHVAPIPLLRGTLDVHDLTAVEPVVEVVETSPKPPHQPTPDVFPRNLPPLSIASIAVQSGRFTYTHRSEGRTASIHVIEIDGTGEHFSSRTDFGSSHTSFDLTCRLEHSGDAEIRADFDLLASPNDDRVTIDLKHQPLQELNGFFVNDNGVRVSGVIDQARTVMHIRQSVLAGTLTAHYHGLALDYLATSDRGTVKSAVKTALQEVLIDHTPDDPPSPVAFRVVRPPEESLIKFMLDGLKPAARKLVSR